MIKGSITYVSETPGYYLKTEWSAGKVMSLTQLFNHVKEFNKTVTDDVSFKSWLNQEKVLKSSNFKLDFSEAKESGKIEVESSKMIAAASLDEAQKRLKAMRHPDAVGEIVRDTDTIKKNKTKQERFEESIKNNGPLTGDELDKKAGRKPGSKVHVLNSMAELETRILTAKEEQEIQNAKLSSVSNNVKIATTENAEKDSSFVVFGDNKEVVNSSKEDNQFTPDKVNKHFQTQRGGSVEKEVTVESIAFATDYNEAIRMINLCKNPTTLKLVRSYLKDNGKHNLVEKIDTRLHGLKLR